jgi:hypothetical protein
MGGAVEKPCEIRGSELSLSLVRATFSTGRCLSQDVQVVITINGIVGVPLKGWGKNEIEKK